MSTTEIASTTPSRTGSAPTIAFRAEQGLWELTHDDVHLYCASLPHAVEHVATSGAIVDMDTVDVRTGDRQVDEALTGLADLLADPTVGDREIAAARREVLHLVEATGLMIGSGDLSILLSCPQGELVPLRVACAAERTASTPWCPFDPDHWHPVRIGPNESGDARARLVAASVDGDAACIVVDLDRRRNRRLLRDGTVKLADQGAADGAHSDQGAADGAHSDSAHSDSAHWDDAHSDGAHSDGAADVWAIDDIEPLVGEALENARRVAPGVGDHNSLVHVHKVDHTDTPATATDAAPGATETTAVVLREPFIVPVATPRSVSATRNVVTWLSERLDCPVEYLFVSTPETTTREDMAEFGTSVLALAAIGIDARARAIVADDVAASIVDACRDRITCMETHASAFRRSAFVGSFAAALLATTRAPVILTGPRFDGSTLLDCDGLAIAIAGEEHEEGVVDAALAFASQIGVPAQVVHVNRPDGPPAADKPPRELGLWAPVAVRTVDAGDDMAETLRDVAGSDWLVVGTHARRGLERIALGSVAFDVAALSTTPVIGFGPETGEPANPAPRTATSAVEDVESLVAVATAAARCATTVDVVMTPAPGWLAQLEVPWG